MGIAPTLTDTKELALYVTVDNETWQEMTFDGESAAWIDMQATEFLSQCADSVGVAIDETVDWSQFPSTFSLLSERAYAEDATPVLA